MGRDEMDPFEVVEPADRSPRSFRTGIIVGCVLAVLVPGALVLGGAVVLGVLIEGGCVPDSAAVPESRIREPTLKFLREEQLVEEDERVLYFYSSGFFSLRADGNLFTDRRVISYWEVDDELYVETAGYHEVAAVDFHRDSSLFADSTITIDRVDESSFDLYVSNESDKDEKFFELLERTWMERRNGEPARKGSALGADVLDFLRAEGIVEADEEVLYFYAKTSGSLSVDGNLFTDRRAISYWEVDEGIDRREARYPQIAGVRAGWGEGIHEVSTVTLDLVEGEPLELWVSQEDGGDRAFVDLLTETWQARR